VVQVGADGIMCEQADHENCRKNEEPSINMIPVMKSKKRFQEVVSHFEFSSRMPLSLSNRCMCSSFKLSLRRSPTVRFVLPLTVSVMVCSPDRHTISESAPRYSVARTTLSTPEISDISMFSGLIPRRYGVIASGDRGRKGNTAMI
jgi:hypothetical protein